MDVQFYSQAYQQQFSIILNSQLSTITTRLTSSACNVFMRPLQRVLLCSLQGAYQPLLCSTSECSVSWEWFPDLVLTTSSTFMVAMFFWTLRERTLVGHGLLAPDCSPSSMTSQILFWSFNLHLLTVTGKDWQNCIQGKLRDHPSQLLSGKDLEFYNTLNKTEDDEVFKYQ